MSNLLTIKPPFGSSIVGVRVPSAGYSTHMHLQFIPNDSEQDLFFYIHISNMTKSLKNPYLLSLHEAISSIPYFLLFFRKSSLQFSLLIIR